MFLLVRFSPRHVFPTAYRIGEPCEGQFPRQIGGTVPAVSPKGTSAHSISVLRHYTFLTHFTVHDARPVSFTVYTVRLSRPASWNTRDANLHLVDLCPMCGATIYMSFLGFLSKSRFNEIATRDSVCFSGSRNCARYADKK